MQSSSVNPRSSEEFDVFLIAQALWRRVWIIIGVTAIAGVLGLLYVFFSERVYEAKGFLVPPTQSDIADLNAGRTKEYELNPYSIEDVYRCFLRNLRSEALRQDFFSNVYLPSLSDEQKARPRDALYSEFTRKFQVSPVTADETGLFSVVVQAGTAETAVDWLEKYVKQAESRAAEELTKNVSYEAKTLAKNIAQEIDSKRETGETERNDAIVKLRAALVIAEASGLQKPTVMFGNTATAASGNMEGEMSFLRGSEALRAEIKNLENRTSNDAFIKELRDLQTKKSYYDKLAVDKHDVGIYRYDGVVVAPESPIKPKKSLVIGLALVLGFMLGLLAAFILYRVEEQRLE